MIRAVALAVLFVYIAMAVLFESWSQPILLMLSVPLAPPVSWRRNFRAMP